MDVTNFGLGKEIIVEAVEDLLAVEADAFFFIDKKTWRESMDKIRKSESNLDYLLGRFGRQGIGSLGDVSKVFAYAVAYRVVGRRLYRSRTPTPLTKERKRYWYARKNELKKALRREARLYRDAEAVSCGKEIVYHLMLRRGSHTYSVEESTDKLYIELQQRGAARKADKDEIYYTTKEYRDPRNNKTKEKKNDETN